MGDADRSLDIEINTTLNSEGTQQGAKELANVKKHAHGAAAGFIHVEKEGKAFHKLMHAISKESPLLGEALRLALNPVTGVIMAGVLALEYFKKKHEEAKKAVEEAAKDIVHSHQEIYDSLIQVKDAQVEEGVAFIEQNIKMKESVQGLEAETGRMIDAIKLQGESLKQLADIQEKYEESQATTEEAKAKVKAKYELVKGHIAEQTELKTLVARTYELQEAQEKAKRLHASTEQAQREDNRPALTEQKKTFERYVKADKEEEEKHPHSELARAKRETDEEQVAAIDREIKDAAKRVSETMAREAENNALVEKLKAELPGLSASYKTHAAEEGLKGSPLSGMIASGADALVALREHHGKVQELTKGQVDAIKALTTLLTAAGVNNTTMVTLIEKSAGDVVKLNARLQAIENRLRSAVTP